MRDCHEEAEWREPAVRPGWLRGLPTQRARCAKPTSGPKQAPAWHWWAYTLAALAAVLALARCAG